MVWQQGCTNTAASAGAARVPWDVRSLLGAVAFPHLRGCLQGQGRCHRGVWDLPVLQILSPVISWPHQTAPAILSHLSICCFYFKFREGLVFPKAYQLFLTRLNGLITKKSTSSSQPCTSYLTFPTPPRSSCISHSSY